MEKILKIAELLGEENAQKIKDEISEILLDYLKSDLDNMCDYIIDYEKLFEDVRKEVFGNVRDKWLRNIRQRLKRSLMNCLRINRPERRTYGRKEIIGGIKTLFRY